MNKILAGMVLIGASSVLAMPAHATLFCSDGNQTQGISVSNMTYDGANANDCYGVVAGNINEQTNVDALVGSKWGDGWTHLVQGDGNGSGSDSGSFGGYNFFLTWDQNTNPNEWTLRATGSPLPANFDFVAALKGSNEYALWLFEGILVDTTATTGTWEIVFTNPGGQIPDLSHLTLFVRGGTAVPEPGGLALLGMGLIGLAVARRRKLI